MGSHSTESLCSPLASHQGTTHSVGGQDEWCRASQPEALEGTWEGLHPSQPLPHLPPTEVGAGQSPQPVLRALWTHKWGPDPGSVAYCLWGQLCPEPQLPRAEEPASAYTTQSQNSTFRITKVPNKGKQKYQLKFTKFETHALLTVRHTPGDSRITIPHCHLEALTEEALCAWGPSAPSTPTLAVPPASRSLDCCQIAWPRFVTTLASSHGTPAQATSCPMKGRPAPDPSPVASASVYIVRLGGEKREQVDRWQNPKIYYENAA